MTATDIFKLKYFAGEPRDSQSGEYFEVFDPSTGQVTAHAPRCTGAEVEQPSGRRATPFPPGPTHRR